MPLAGYAWSQIRTWSELALAYGSDSVWKVYSKQKPKKRKSQLLTKLCGVVHLPSAFYGVADRAPDFASATAGNRRISDNFRCLHNFLRMGNVLCQLVVRKLVGLSSHDDMRPVVM